MKYFVHIAYNGAKYRGWQRQPNVRSVQEVIETTIEKMMGQFVTVFGFGRTDAGVHASQYFFHIEVEEAFQYDPVFRLNKMLPDDIAVFDVLPMPDTVHARFDAVARTYDYFIHRYKDPFLKQGSSYYSVDNLDVDRMKKAVTVIRETRDFRSLCKQPDIYKHTNCAIHNAQLFSDETGDRLRFQITANRFLRGMIRKIVARLVDIGRDELSLDEFTETLEKKEFFEHKNNAYAQGLFLSRIKYRYLDIPQRTSFSSLFESEGKALWKEV